MAIRLPCFVLFKNPSILLTITAFVYTKATFFSHHFVYRNANKIRDSRNEKYIGIANLIFPFRYGLGTHSQKFSKLTLCEPMLLTVI